MAGTGKYTSAVILAVVMIIMGAGAAEASEMKAAAPSPTMEAGAASILFLPSLFASFMASFIPFLAYLLFN